MTEALTTFGTSVLAFVWFGQARYRESMGRGKKRERTATAHREQGGSGLGPAAQHHGIGDYSRRITRPSAVTCGPAGRAGHGVYLPRLRAPAHACMSGPGASRFTTALSSCRSGSLRANFRALRQLACHAAWQLELDCEGAGWFPRQIDRTQDASRWRALS
jgi:hypothetical protein